MDFKAIQKERKTDRRTLYTRSVIKDAFLMLKSSMSYNDITISGVCREADINRGTFYLHYDNIRQVLDEVLDDALRGVHGPIGLLDPDEDARKGCALPLCLFLRENEKYQSVFFDDALSSVVIERFAASAKDAFVEKMLEKDSLSKEACEALFYFQISGCLAVCKRNAARRDAQWKDLQCAIDKMLKDGLRKF